MPLAITKISDETIDAEDLAQRIVGRGIFVTNARYTGSLDAAGVFTDDFGVEEENIVLREGHTRLANSGDVIIDDDLFLEREIFELDDSIINGVVLSTGNLDSINESNLDGIAASTSFGLVGDGQLETVNSPEPTFDAAVLTFDFIPDQEDLLFRFVFASDEYQRFANRQFNDAFAFFIDGPGVDNQNIATLQDTQFTDPEPPISINTLNNNLQAIVLDADADIDENIDDADVPELGGIDPNDPFPDPHDDDREFLLRNNIAPGGTVKQLHDFEFNRLTTILDARISGIQPNSTYSAKLVISDTFDEIFDSAVFIQDQDDVPITRFLNAVDDTANTLVNESITIDILANDVDPQRDDLTIIEFDQTSREGGAITLSDNGTPLDFTDDRLIYTPPANFVGTGDSADTFSYTISDSANPFNDPVNTDTATVNVNVFGEAPPTEIINDDNVFVVGGDPDNPFPEEVQIKLTLQGRSANFVNEIGVVIVDDEQNQINSVPPSDSRYVRELFLDSETVFSALRQDITVNINATRHLTFSPGDRLLFYMVQDDSTETVKERLDARRITPNVFFAIPEANTDNSNHLLVDQGNNSWTLRWEDLAGGGDSDFNDLIMTIEVSDQLLPTTGTGLQGERELIDLREEDPLAAQFLVQSDAAYQNTVGFYRIEDKNGTIRVSNVDGTTSVFSPGDEGYARAAVENTIVSFDRNGGSTPVLSGLVAPYIITNDDTEGFLNGNPRNLRGRLPLAFFPFTDANPDGVDHIRLLGDNTFGFEDLPDGGDFDFEDMVVEVDFL